ncbi:MAG: multicopper oxidase domain-containing protein [Bacteroidota bacterium]
MKKILFLFFMVSSVKGYSQFVNPLAIPPALTGTNFNLNVQNGSTQFWNGITTPTYGINGNILGPTLIMNKWDNVTIHVTNSLTGSGNSTTMHWHGLHVPAKFDGGPHQMIMQGMTWSPQFTMLNNAGTYWYHPHGNNQTDRQVSKGLAGMIIVKDSTEAALNLPRNYGVDDFPIVVQTKAFDVLNQIAISTAEDTLVVVNGTAHPYLDAPAQVIRLRLLNGSSIRSYNFGFSGNMPFKIIATDGGLLDSARTLTRILLNPGERVELLLDLQNLQGNTVYLNSYSNELPNGIYGAATVTSMMGGTITDYNLNPLNGAIVGILKLNVVAPTVNPVLTTPISLVTQTPITNYTVSRTFTLQPDTMMNAQQQVEGPFNINGTHFNMNVINVTTYLNTTEKWRIQNNTGIAHPFHIHDVQFTILNVNGGAVPNYEKGKKDVVLVMPMQYVEFVTTFNDFADDSIPYMYHCHLLHHEDDGMMGSFRVIDSNATAGIVSMNEEGNFTIFPNPTNSIITIKSVLKEILSINLTNSIGEILENIVHPNDNFQIDLSKYKSGVYYLHLKSANRITIRKIIKTD